MGVHGRRQGRMGGHVPRPGQPLHPCQHGHEPDEPPTGMFDVMWTMPMGDMKVGDSGMASWMGAAMCSVDGGEPKLCGSWLTDHFSVTIVQGAAAVQVASA